MSLIVYCSYPMLNQAYEPSWVSNLETVFSVNKIDAFRLYRPWFPLRSQPRIMELLHTEPHPFFVSNRESLGLPDIIFQDFDSKIFQDYLQKYDHPEPNNFLTYRDLYCLVRSHILLVDVSVPSYGETFHDAFFAKMARIPMVGLTSRFLNSPIMMNYIDVFMNPEKIDVLIRQLVSYSQGYQEVIKKTESSADHKPSVPEDTSLAGELAANGESNNS